MCRLGQTLPVLFPYLIETRLELVNNMINTTVKLNVTHSKHKITAIEIRFDLTQSIFSVKVRDNSGSPSEKIRHRARLSDFKAAGRSWEYSLQYG